MLRSLGLLLAISVAASLVIPGETVSATTSTAALQQTLAKKGFYRGAITGVYDTRTKHAVMAFRKEIGATRSYSWSDSLWDALNNYRGPWTPFREGEPDRVEVNLSKQVLYFFDDGALAGVFPISSGNGEPYQGQYGSTVYAHTPTGDFEIQRHIVGRRESFLGVLWNPWYFTGGYALHGSSSVPSYPASHGCVRMTMWDSDWVESRFYVGLPVHVWHEPAHPVDQDEMFFYRATDGLFRYYNLTTSGSLGPLILQGSGYSPGWTSITSVDMDGD